MLVLPVLLQRALCAATRVITRENMFLFHTSAISALRPSRCAQWHTVTVGFCNRSWGVG